MSKIFSEQTKERLAIVLMFVAAALLRLQTNFSTEYIGGNNGAYYLVQIRGLLENGKIPHFEFPILFWLEAAIAFIPYKLGIANINASIDLTSRIFDSLVPALSIIPAYLLVKKILASKEKIFTTIVFASASVFYFSFLVLISDFQKNSLGLLWLFWLNYFLLRIHEEGTLKNYLLASMFFILTGLTHYGCIAVALCMVVLDLIVKYSIALNWKKILRALFLALIVITFCLGLIYLVSKWRFDTFIKIPLELFHDPVIIFLLKRNPVLSPFDIINSLHINLTALIALFLFVKNYKSIDSKIQSFILTMIILSFFLASPFLGIETAQRLYFISYLTAIPLLPFIYTNIKHEKKKQTFVYLLAVILIHSIVIVKARKPESNMNKALYSEMLEIDKKIVKHDRVIVVARHGMEFWSEWIFRTDAVREDALTENYWRWYTDIYFLHQKKMKPQFGPAGAFGAKFPEPNLPGGSYLISRTNMLELYKAPFPPKDFSIFRPKR